MSRTILIAVIALLAALGAVAYVVARPAASPSKVSALNHQVASLRAEVAQLKSGPIRFTAGDLIKLTTLQTNVSCLRKWQDKLRGVQPSFLVPANGYPPDDYLLTQTGTFLEC